MNDLVTRLAELREKITPGPWRVALDEEKIYAADDQVTIVWELGTNEANAELIALAPTMADEIEKLRAALLWNSRP